MIRLMKRLLALLLPIPLAFTPLAALAKEDSGTGVQQPYETFLLMEAKEAFTPPSPFGALSAASGESDAMASFEAWWLAQLERQEAVVPNLAQVRSFTRDSARLILAGDGAWNLLYSPVDIWFYLELLSHLTEGNSQAQVLRLLGREDASDPQAEGEALYQAVYWNDGESAWLPSSSGWIGEHTQLSDTLLARLAARCHTSVFRGPMGGQAFTEAYRSWLNEKTNRLMEDTVNALGFSPDTGISLCTALYMRGSWSLPFDREDTGPDVFYAAGGETTASFMKREEAGGTVYLGSGFSSVIMDLQDGGYVTFVLPDPEGNNEKLLQSDALFDYLYAGREWTGQKHGKVRIAVPQIDIQSAVPVQAVLASMGVTDAFDPEKNVFSGEIASDDSLKLTSVEQYSRLIMDEDGVEAASMTVTEGALPHPASEETIDFILNRPFLFAVFSATDVPVFIGVYNSP